MMNRRAFLGRSMLALGCLPLARFAAGDSLPLRIVYFDNFSPFCWVNEKGDMQGLLVDTLNEALGQRLNLSLQHNGFPWIRAQQMVKASVADAFCTVPT